MSEYLKFEETESKPRTKVWDVFTRDGNEFGEIKWYARWRQYSYCIDDLVFTEACLRCLADFISKHKKDRVVNE